MQYCKEHGCTGRVMEEITKFLKIEPERLPVSKCNKCGRLHHPKGNPVFSFGKKVFLIKESIILKETRGR